MVPPAARQTPKSVPATAALSCALPRPEAQPCHGAYRLHCAALSCAQRRPEAQPCNGTPSCATSAQERTGLIMNSNIHAAVHQAVWRRMPLNFFLSTSSSLLPVSATSKCNCAAALPWVKPFVFIWVCVCVCCELMKATFAHVGIQQGHPTPSGKTWPLQQSRHHLQTSHVFF